MKGNGIGENIRHTYWFTFRNQPRQFLLTLAALIISLAAPLYAAPDLEYTISPDWGTDNRHFTVTLRFHGESDGTTTVRIPHAWAWQDSYDKGIRDFRAVSEQTSVARVDSDYAYIVHHKPGAQITVQYDVVQYWNEPVTRDVYYRPILGTDYFYFIGYGVFAFPDWDTQKQRDIRVLWKGLPPTWKLACSFGVKAPDLKFRRSLDQLCHAAYMGGDISLSRMDVEGYPVYISTYGQWRFTRNELNVAIGRTVSAVREFWNDYEFPFFLVTMIPLDQPCCSKGGTGLTDSYSLFVSPEMEDVDDLNLLFAHELFHTWNGRKIQRQQPEELVYWFAEGFTNYYARLILLRSGLTTLREYVDDINRTLVDLYQSPVRDIPNREVLARTHQDQAIERIPYLRGDLLAVRWDAEIKRTTNLTSSLDNLMRDLLRAATNRGVVVSAGSVDSLIRPYWPAGVANDIAHFIDSGNTMTVSAGDLGPCVSLDTAEIVPFVLGFDYVKPPTGQPWVISGVDSSGPAFAAGLRDGMVLIGRSISWNHSQKPVILRVRKDSTLSTIEYFPQGAPVRIPQFRIDSDGHESDSSSCLKWFGL